MGRNLSDVTAILKFAGVDADLGGGGVSGSPSYVRIKSETGTNLYLFSGTSGLRVHTSVPTDDGDGSIIGTVGAGEITATELDDDAVTTAKILAANVTSAKLAANTIQIAEVTLTATEIVGTSAGDIGHAAGAVLVAAPGAGNLLEFVSATLIYDFDTAAYTGGNNDLVIRQGTTAVSAAIADADLVGDSADDIAFVNALSAADIKLTANSTLNLAGTAYTQPGTAAGVLRVKVAYRVHATEL